MKRSKLKVLSMATVIAVLFIVSGNTQAQTCTLDNWSAKVGEANLSVGTPGDGNRRYAGPCGLRVALQGSAAYLIDNSPTAETVFNVRFYFFLNDVTADVTIFEALDSGDSSVFSVTYDQSAGAVNAVFNHASGTETVSVGGVSTGWNSVEIQWEAKAAERPFVTVAHASDSDSAGALADIDTSALTIDTARLGALSAPATVPTGGSVDFDDYDSRRDTVPGRICRGLTDEARSELNLEDVQAIFTDFATGGSVAAGGTPDFNGSGSVDLQDVNDVFVRFASGQNACSANR